MMPGNITPQPDMQRKFRIVGGAHDEVVKAMIGDPCARIPRNGAHNVGFTPLDQNVGDCLAEYPTLRDRAKVGLAVVACANGDVLIAKYARLTENLTCNGNIVIEGQCSNQCRGRVRANRDMACEFNPRLCLDHRSERLEHLIKQLDLLVGKVSRAGSKQIGQSYKGFYLSLCRS